MVVHLKLYWRYDMKLHRLIGKIVQGLQNKNFKQQNNIKAFGSDIRFFLFHSDLFKSWTKQLSINSLINFAQRITRLVYRMKAVVKIEKSKLNHVGLHGLAINFVEFPLKITQYLEFVNMIMQFQR